MPTPQESAAVVATDVRKRFGDREAVAGINVSIAPGEVFGFLGPNGAGKTSMMRMISGVSPLTSGSLTVLGLDVGEHKRAIKRRIGVVPQDDNLDQFLTAQENLTLYGHYFDLPRAALEERVATVLAWVQLTDRAQAEVRTLSGGMRRRLLVARSLIQNPQLVILDEPTTGLDPQARHVLWERLRYLKREQRTLIISTHYMDEAEHLCDRLVIMEQGKILAQGSPSQLIAAHTSGQVIEVYGEAPALAAALALLSSQVDAHESLADCLLLYTSNPEHILSELHSKLSESHQILRRQATLEDVFLKLTGRRLRDG